MNVRQAFYLGIQIDITKYKDLLKIEQNLFAVEVFFFIKFKFPGFNGGN